MTKDEIFSKLDAMLADSKKRNFLNHLVRSYVPISKAERVFDKPKGPFNCVLTNVQLFSLQEVLEGTQTEEFKKNLFDSLKLAFDDKTPSVTPIKKLIGDKKLGVSGENTTTFMSLESYQDFFDWVITKSLNGDKHISWLLGDIRRESFIERAKEFGDDNLQAKVKKIEPKKRGATYSLGDASDALLKLKENLEKNEIKNR
jgi:hypothetical protein